MTFDPAADIPAERSNIERDDWETPVAIFHQYHVTLGFNFTIDVAANAANRVVPRYFDKEANGLLKSWRGERVWLHPPHAEGAQWAEKAQREAARGVVVVGLMPARTYQSWWHDFVAPTARVRFLVGHLPFRLGGIPVVAGQRKVEAPRGGFAIVEWHRGAS